MPVNRRLWRSWLNERWIPAWPCPRCSRPTLTLFKDSLKAIFDAETSEHWNEPWFAPDEATGRFVCLLRCSRSECDETCAVSGNYKVESSPEDGSYYDSCRPTAITPPPQMIDIPHDCPADIRSEVVSAFALYWNDLASSLNRIRNALELVLNGLRIPKTTLNDKNKRVRLVLHHRIEKLRKLRPKLTEICDRMMAVKHLGNAGSHPGIKVEDDDVFDGFDILERVLNDMYSDHHSELARVVKQINKRKGPRKRDS